MAQGPIAPSAWSCWEPALSQRRGHGEGVIRERRAANFPGKGREDLDEWHQEPGFNDPLLKESWGGVLDNEGGFFVCKNYILSFIPKSNSPKVKFLRNQCTKIKLPNPLCLADFCFPSLWVGNSCGIFTLWVEPMQTIF